MNRSQWETRLAELQRQEKALWKKIGKLQTEIHDCIVNIETKRRQEVISNRQLGSRRLKPLADVTYPGKEIDGTSAKP